MVQDILEKYSDFFDKRIKSGSIIVPMIAVLIISVGLFIPNSWNESYTKANILDASQPKNIVLINGERYEVTFKKL